MKSEIVYIGSKIHVEEQHPRITKTIFKQQEEKFVVTDIEAQCISIIIQRVWYWCKERELEQLNRIKSPETTQAYMESKYMIEEAQQITNH